MSTMIDRIRSKYIVDQHTGCHVWTGAKHPGGYANIAINRKAVRVHRLIWELAHGKLAAGLVVRHTCDNTLCVNLNHLIAGTQADNVRDMISRGRKGITRSVGSKHWNSRLTEVDIPVIWRLLHDGQTLQTVADRYGVTQSLIGQIKKRRIWRHVSLGDTP